jgi:type II secretion system protein N
VAAIRIPSLKLRPEHRRKVLLWTGYVAFFVFSFLLFAYWTFPYERVRDWVIQQVEYPPGPGGARKASGWQLEIVKLSPDWFTGVELRGVRVVKLPDKPQGKKADVTFEHITADASLFSLLFGELDGSFQAKTSGGTISGEGSHSEESSALKAEIDGVDLRRVQLLRAFLPLPIAGRLNGTIDLTLPKKISQASGRIALDGMDMRIGDGKSKLPIPGFSEGLSFPSAEIGNLTLRANVEEGTLRIEELQASGPDAELSGRGTISLMRRLRMSRLNLLLRVKFTDTFRNKSDAARRLLSAAEMMPPVKKAQTDDEAFQFKLSGTFGQVRGRPAGNAKAP